MEAGEAEEGSQRGEGSTPPHLLRLRHSAVSPPPDSHDGLIIGVAVRGEEIKNQTR